MRKYLEVSITPCYICRQLKRKTMDNNIPKGCKPFDLEKAMAGEPVVTRDGRPYKFGAYNPDAEYPIIGWIGLYHQAHQKDGSYVINCKSDSDLFMAAKTQKVWVNLWVDKTNFLQSTLCHTLQAQEQYEYLNSHNIIKTIETEVEL